MMDQVSKYNQKVKLRKTLLNTYNSHALGKTTSWIRYSRDSFYIHFVGFDPLIPHGKLSYSREKYSLRFKSLYPWQPSWSCDLGHIFDIQYVQCQEMTLDFQVTGSKTSKNPMFPRFPIDRICY